MTDFASARLNMVESQIRTNRVSDVRLLEAMESVPREIFVPDELRGIAYVDEDISIGQGRHLMQPMVLGRLLQSAAPGPEDMVLDIACASGYSTAVLARLAATVAAVESEASLVEKGNKILNDLGIDNAVIVEGELRAGYSKQAPYDVILLGGGVAEVPKEITDQLAEGGRLVTVIMEENGLGRATLMQRNGSVVSSRVVFDVSVPLLSDFTKAPGFVF